MVQKQGTGNFDQITDQQRDALRKDVVKLTPEQRELLRTIAGNEAMLYIIRHVVEDALIDFRDSRIAQIRNNGLVCKEKDGSPSSVIRFGIDHAVRIGLNALADFE